MLHTYQDHYGDVPHALTAHSNMRQLLGPSQQPYADPALSPVAMGRPAVPTTLSELAQHEDFADIVEPHTPAYATTYDQDRDGAWTPPTATTIGIWTDDTRPQHGRSRVSMTTSDTPEEVVNRSAPTRVPLQPIHMPLPLLRPMSPLLSGFDLRRSSIQPLAIYENENESTHQKRLYTEVAQAAGVTEPLTPHIPLDGSTSSNETTSSFSAHEPTRRLPSLTATPSQTYVHGQPLSSIPSSSDLHGQADINPFESGLAPPYSVSSGFPSLKYPPPSPGGMSVPGSVNDSPRRWSGGPSPLGARGQSMFDEEDAYGGI